MRPLTFQLLEHLVCITWSSDTAVPPLLCSRYNMPTFWGRIEAKHIYVNTLLILIVQ